MPKKTIPRNVLKLILYHVHSQRYLAQCALVNSRWLRFSQKQMYKSIHFYTFLQFLHFLETVPYMEQGRSVLYMVRHVTFHFDLLAACAVGDCHEGLTSKQMALELGIYSEETDDNNNNNNNNNDNNSDNDNDNSSSNNKNSNINANSSNSSNSNNKKNKKNNIPIKKPTEKEIAIHDVINAFGVSFYNTDITPDITTTTNNNNNNNDDDDDDDDDKENKKEIKIKKGNNELINRLLTICYKIETITILDKEKHMKQLRYMDTSQSDQYAYLINWAELKNLPYWHNDAQITIAAVGHRLEQLDIYTATSGIQLIDQKQLYFTLPTFPNLTHLHIDFFNQDQSYIIDRFIMDTIHQKCHLLTNLTLYNVDLFLTTASSVSENVYEWDTHRLRLPERSGNTAMEHHTWNIMFKEDLITSTMIPAKHMKQLVLKNIRFLNSSSSSTVDYLIQKYPKLTHLDLQLDFVPFGAIPDEIIEKRKEFQSAMYKLVTHLPDLTSYHYTLHPSINEECGKAIWPQQQLLTWLGTHSRQLTSLSWPCDLYDLSLSPLVSSSSTSPSSSSSFFIINNHPQLDFYTSYLLHLTELNLTIGNQCGEQLIMHDFLLLHHRHHDHSTSLLPRLQSLTINHMERALATMTTTDHQHHYTKEEKKKQMNQIKKKNKKINIFTWLTICPQLRSLTLKGVDLIDATDDDDDHEEKKEKKEKKAKRKENMPIYSLNKLTLEQVDIYMKHGLDDICQRCPQLKVLWCDYINCRWEPISMANYIDNYALFCENPIFILDASQLTLDTLYLGHINYQFQEYNYTFTLDKAVIYELGISEDTHHVSNSFTVADSSYQHMNKGYNFTYQSFMEVYCRLVDQVTFMGCSNMEDDRTAFQAYIMDQQKIELNEYEGDLTKQYHLTMGNDDNKQLEEWACLGADELFATSDRDMDDDEEEEDEYMNIIYDDTDDDEDMGIMYDDDDTF